mgnify:CR=1 FL=1
MGLFVNIGLIIPNPTSIVLVKSAVEVKPKDILTI